MRTDAPPVALTVAGSDSGGGAGIQADLKTFHAFGVFGTSAITAITAQNTREVRSVHAVPLDMVADQIAAVAEDLTPRAVKTGMLATAPLVEAVSAALEAHALAPIVVDPVMVATTGARLLDPEAVEGVRDALLPIAAVVTPNLPEAGLLVGRDVESPEQMRSAARELVDRGARAVLVKGGHRTSDEVVDLFWDGSTERVWRRSRIPTRRTHGTGCTLSAAIAACLARRLPLHDAVDVAIDYVTRAIRRAPALGSGSGPLDHWVEPRFDRAER